MEVEVVLAVVVVGVQDREGEVEVEEQDHGDHDDQVRREAGKVDDDGGEEGNRLGCHRDQMGVWEGMVRVHEDRMEEGDDYQRTHSRFDGG